MSEKNAPVSLIENFDEDQELLDNKFLTFKVSNEQYGIGIEYVIEIIEVIKITPIPDTKDYIKGVINLRGKVIPVMNVRLRFGMEEIEYDSKTCIIVVKVDDLEIGIIVDTVCEVLDIASENIQDSPEIHKKEEQKYIMGMGKVDNEVNILLDLSKLLFDERININQEKEAV